MQRVIKALRATVTGAQPGARLPSVRDLMAEHHASPVTVQQALRALAAQGVVEVRPGRGSFVAALGPEPAEPTDYSWQSVALGAGRVGREALNELLAIPGLDTIPLSGGYLDPALQPVAALGNALARAARRPEAWGRGPVEGRAELRAWFAAQAGGRLRAADMTVCSGGQPALATAFRALAAPGDPVLVESPTYLGAIAAARDAGLHVVPVPTDRDGIRPDLLDATLRRTGARLVYCQPLHANPHGAVLAADRRAPVLAALAAAGAFLIEDDWARGLSIDASPPPLAADDVHGHVVYLRSLSKLAAPGLRIAALGARGAAGVRLRTSRVVDDFFVAGPLQEAALEFVSAPAWDRHLRNLRAGLRARRDALLAAVARDLPDLTVPLVVGGGLHAWLRLPDGVDDGALTVAAAAARRGDLPRSAVVRRRAGRDLRPADLRRGAARRAGGGRASARGGVRVAQTSQPATSAGAAASALNRTNRPSSPALRYAPIGMRASPASTVVAMKGGRPTTELTP